MSTPDLHADAAAISNASPAIKKFAQDVADILQPKTAPPAFFTWDARSAPLDPNSASLIQAWMQYAVSAPQLVVGQWAVATAVASPGDPSYTIPLTKQGGSLQVRIPLGAQPDPEADHHLTVRDPTTERKWARETAKFAEGIGALDVLYEAVDALRDCEWCGLAEHGGHERWCPVVN